MVMLLEQVLEAPSGLLGREVDERAARRSLRDQIARLERELAATAAAAAPHWLAAASVPGAQGPRVLGLGELERIRDGLAGRLADARSEISARGDAQERSRELLERMLLAPADYKYCRVTAADIGDNGCVEYRSVPRLGPVGLLTGWWRVKVSSGCPLVGRRARQRIAAPPAAPPTAPKARRDEAPPAPWGTFPLVELATLLAIVVAVVGIVVGNLGAVLAAAALGSLAGLELAIREHFAGYRSHTTLLAGAVAFVLIAGLTLAGLRGLFVMPPAGAAFAAAFFALREAFRRRAGGLGFRA